MLYPLLLLLMPFLYTGCENDGKDNAGKTSTGTSAGQTATPTGGSVNGGGEESPDNPSLGNVPFYGNREQVKQQMAKIPGVTPDMTITDQRGSTLNWTGGRFDGLPVDQWGFSFYRGQMLYASLHYTTETSGMKADPLYDSLTSAMNARHGMPIMDSKNRASKSLNGYSESDQSFISDVGQSLAGTDFRMWTSGDTTAPFIAVIYRAPRQGESEIKDVYINWYDQTQHNDYKRMIEAYGTE